MPLSIAIAIFARMDSRRLPGKALLPIAGTPMLDRVIDRLMRVAHPAMLVVATSKRPTDDPIAELAHARQVRTFRGATHDVLGRAHACLTALGSDHLVRISGDSPFIDPALVDRAIERHLADAAEITTNVHPTRTRPPGQSVEILSRGALDRLTTEAREAEDREHVTRYAYRHADAFRIAGFDLPADPPAATRLVVDDPTDLARADWLARQLGDGFTSADADTITRLARRWTPSREAAHG